MDSNQYDVVIVGAGFTGLTAAYELTKKGLRVCLVDADTSPGGLAGTFEFSDGVRLEKYYHHWFNNDTYVPDLARDLGMENDVLTLPSKTGVYFSGKMWKLSTPMDLLRFTPLSFIDRIRLGLLVFQVRRVKDWHTIENLSIREWLEPLCGKSVFRVVWEPLIRSKFSIYAEDVNAVWFWKKLVLRGSTRDKRGGEVLAYFKGGFGRLIDAMVTHIERAGGVVKLGEKVIGVVADGNRLTALQTDRGEINGGKFLFTPAFPIIADIFSATADPEWISRLRRVRYLGNMCLVLRLDRSLSDTYWLNVNDPGFPYVGVIEHTNFDGAENYKGSHIVFLSRYLATEDPVWNYNDQEYLELALQHLTRMFPEMERSSILDYRVWRTEYGQPVTERGYSKYVPDKGTPYENAFISTMAQIYPEDRGTNYAIREGRDIVIRMSKK